MVTSTNSQRPFSIGKQIGLVIFLTSAAIAASDQTLSSNVIAAPATNTSIACQTSTKKVSETPKENTAEVSTTKPSGCLPVIPIECQVATLKLINSDISKQSVDNGYLLIYADKDQFTEIINAIPGEAEKAQLLRVASGYLDVLNQQKPERIDSFSTQIVEVTKAFKEPESRVGVFIEIVEQLVKLKQLEKATQVLPLAFNSLQSLPKQDLLYQEWKEELSIKLISMYAAVGDFSTANRLTLDLSSLDAREQAKVKIAEGYVERQEIEKALEVVNKIKAQSYKIDVLIKVATYYAKANRKSEASMVLTQAFNIAKTVDGEDDQDKATLLNDLAIEFAKVGLDQQAFQVIQAIDSERKANEAYDLASYYLKNAQYDKVQQVVEVMRQMGDREWVNFTLSDLAQKYIEQKRYDEALKIANSLDVENQKMGASFSTGSESRSGKLGVLTYLASAYAKNGEQQKSNELFDTVFKLAKTADPSQMAEVAITHYETTGDRKRPIELVDQAWQKINQNKKLAIKEPGQVKFELDSIATSYSLLGQYEKTMQALFQARQLDKDRLDMLDRFEISDPSGSDGILSSAAIRLSYKGQFEEAIKFVNSIKSNKEKDKTFSTMAQNIAAIKQYEQAFQLINEISDVAERDRLTQLVSCAKKKQ